MPMNRSEVRIGRPIPKGASYFSDAKPLWIGGEKLAVRTTIPQELKPINPEYLDFGVVPFDFSHQFREDTTHISLGVSETSFLYRNAVNFQRYQTDGYHRKFGWGAPKDKKAFAEVGHALLKQARRHMDLGKYKDRPLLISMELIKTQLPVPEDSRYAYDELIHTDALDPLWPVAQVFWANVRHSVVSTDPVLVGEGQESFAHTGGTRVLQDPRNLVYGGIYHEFSLPNGHLIIADGKALPHARPDLSLPLEEDEDSIRYYLRGYIEPLRKPGDKLPNPKPLGEMLTREGLGHLVLK